MFEPILFALGTLKDSAEELRELDAQIGDGDLGVTVSKGADAVIESLSALQPEATLSEVLLTAGRAFGNANPSTFGALTQGGLLAASKATKEASLPLSPDSLKIILAAITESISVRGKTQQGDKTVLDPLLASMDTLSENQKLDNRLVSDMASAAAQITDELAASPSKKGRAAWVGARSVGVRDPGSVAYVRFLEALSLCTFQDASA